MKVKKRLKTSIIIIINILLFIISLLLENKMIHDSLYNFLIALIYIIIFYNFNIVYKRMLKSK
jgi:hypothetical protein